MYRKNRNLDKDDEEDGEDSPLKSKKFKMPKMQDLHKKVPEPDSLDIEKRTAEGYLDREFNTLPSLVDFCKDQFKDVYDLFKVAKNRILKVELSTSKVDHRMETIVNANNVVLQKLDILGLRLDKLEKLQIDDMKSVETSFEMQKANIDQLEIKLKEMNQKTSEFLPRSEFYQMTHDFVRDEKFKFFEESVERNYLEKNRINREFENVWNELKSSSEYMT